LTRGFAEVFEECFWKMLILEGLLKRKIAVCEKRGIPAILRRLWRFFYEVVGRESERFAEIVGQGSGFPGIGRSNLIECQIFGVTQIGFLEVCAFQVGFIEVCTLKVGF
jgi:hypothetical protein